MANDVIFAFRVLHCLYRRKCRVGCCHEITCSAFLALVMRADCFANLYERIGFQKLPGMAYRISYIFTTFFGNFQIDSALAVIWFDSHSFSSWFLGGVGKYIQCVISSVQIGSPLPSVQSGHPNGPFMVAIFSIEYPRPFQASPP